MKVLFISGGDYKYGAPRSLMPMIEGLKEKYGIEVILLTKKRNPLNDYCTKKGIENYSFWYRDIMAGSPYTNKFLTICKHFVKYMAFLWGGITMRNVTKLPIDFSSIDIIHSNTNRQDIGAYIAAKYNIKHVWHIREMGKEDYNVIFYKKNCIRYMNTHADAFIMISNAVRYKWQNIKLDAKKMCVVYDGVNAGKIKENAECAENKIKVIMTGHIQPNKGQLHLIKAVAKLPVRFRNLVEVDIVGEAYKDYLKEIKRFIEEMGLESQIHFLGYRNDISNILCRYDIGVTCSRAEGYGRCTVEYMMAGLATIASDTGANVEIIENNVTGMVYRYGDIENLSDILKWLIEHAEERELIAQNGMKTARTRFSGNQYIEEIYGVYKNV